MKTIANIIYLLAIAITFSSCSPTNYLTLSVTQPAPIYIPKRIKSIGIINRSQASASNKKLDQLDKILSAEGKNMDKDGANAAIDGLFDELTKNNNFVTIKIIDSLDIKNQGLNIFPAALSWEKVSDICNTHKIDAIFSLASYDTDSKVDYKVVTKQVEGPLGISIPLIEHHATVNTIIKTGWRIYDVTDKIILDEQKINKSLVSTGSGVNPTKAVQAVIGRKADVKRISNNIGKNYALSLIPYRIRVSRHYFVRGTDNFVIGKRRAQTGDWDGAAELWKKELTNPKTKIAGRAYYNMAISNEINGNLGKALDWASKAYTDYNIKLALKYVNVLKYRMAQEQQLKQESEE